MKNRLSSENNINIESKCPFVNIKKMFLLGVNKVLGSNFLYTTKYGLKELGIKNVKKDYDTEYSKLNKNELLNFCKNGGSIKEFCNKNSLNSEIIEKLIERDFSMVIFNELMDSISNLNIYAFGKKTVNNNISSENIIISEFLRILDFIIVSKINTTEIGQISRYINLEGFNNKNKYGISDRLYIYLVDDGINATVNLVNNYINKIKSGSDSYSRASIIECFKNSKDFLSQNAYSNQPLYYLNGGKKRNIDKYYNKNENIFHFGIKEKVFKALQIKDNFILPEYLNYRYMGCPILYGKYKIDNSNYNGIVAYQIKIAEIICFLEGID